MWRGRYACGMAAAVIQSVGRKGITTKLGGLCDEQRAGDRTRHLGHRDICHNCRGSGAWGLGVKSMNMKDARTICHAHGIYERRAIQAAELMAQAIADDLQALLIDNNVRPLHERVAEYIKVRH